MAAEPEHTEEELSLAMALAMASPFRVPSYLENIRYSNDSDALTSRGLVSTAWCGSVLDTSRLLLMLHWFGKRPWWCINLGVWLEVPYALSYEVYKICDEDSAAWRVFNSECYHLAAGRVHTLMTDKVFIMMEDIDLQQLGQLDLYRYTDGPGRRAMLYMFKNMRKAMEGFSWTIFFKVIIRRNSVTRAARQVHVDLDLSAKIGLVLNNPYRGFYARASSEKNADWPLAADAGDEARNANFGTCRSCRERRLFGGSSRRSESPKCRRSVSPVRAAVTGTKGYVAYGGIVGSPSHALVLLLCAD